MRINKTIRGRSLPRYISLFAGLCLVLASCGSGTESVATAAAAPTPTPVPTTAPLSLPPADDTLPALAPLPASVPVVAAAPSAVASSSEATPTPDGAVLTIASADQWNDCLIVAAKSADAQLLLDPIVAGTETDMTSVQLNSLAAASVGCDMVNNSLSQTDVGDYVPTSSSCLDAWLGSSGGGSVFVGLASIGWGQATPSWAQPQLIQALDACLSGASFTADVMAVVSAEPSLTGAFDSTCLTASFDNSGTMASFAQALATNPAAASLSVGLGDAWVLSCANVGQMVAAAASADGVSLSTSSVVCIDSELKSTGAIAQLLAGTADADAIGIATISCLTDAEASALLG